MLVILKKQHKKPFINPKAFLCFLHISVNKKKHLDVSGLKWSQEIPRAQQHFLPPLFKNGKLKEVYELFSGAPNTAPCEPLFWQECFFLRQHRLGKKELLMFLIFRLFSLFQVMAVDGARASVELSHVTM